MLKALSDEQLKRLLYPDGRQKDIYRKISYPLVKIILPLKVHPDLIHLFRLLFILTGTILFFTGNHPLVIVGALFFQLNILLDTFDGALARHQGVASVRGEYQDVALDHLCSSALYFMAAAGLGFAQYHNSIFLWLGLATVALAQLAAFLRAMYLEYGVEVSSTKNGNALVRYAHQDNSRLIAFVLLLSAVFVLPQVAVVFFVFLVLAKTVILAVDVWAKSGKNPFSLRIFFRYNLTILYIILFLAEKLLGVRLNTAKQVITRSRKRSVVEKQVIARLN